MGDLQRRLIESNDKGEWLRRSATLRFLEPQVKTCRVCLTAPPVTGLHAKRKHDIPLLTTDRPRFSETSPRGLGHREALGVMQFHLLRFLAQPPEAAGALRTDATNAGNGHDVRSTKLKCIASNEFLGMRVCDDRASQK